MMILWLVIAAVDFGLALSGRNPGASVTQGIGALAFASSYYFFPK